MCLGTCDSFVRRNFVILIKTNAFRIFDVMIFAITVIGDKIVVNWNLRAKREHKKKKNKKECISLALNWNYFVAFHDAKT